MFQKKNVEKKSPTNEKNIAVVAMKKWTQPFPGETASFPKNPETDTPLPVAAELVHNER